MLTTPLSHTRSRDSSINDRDRDLVRGDFKPQGMQHTDMQEIDVSQT